MDFNQASFEISFTDTTFCQKQRFGELQFEYLETLNVMNKLYIILSQLCLVEIALTYQ